MCGCLRKANNRFRQRLTERKKRMLISDEYKGVREYRALGFYGLARDEARHAKILKRR